MSSEPVTFWDHLDELRSVIIRIAVVTLVFGVLAFCFKEPLFAVVLGPQDPSFITYDLFSQVEMWFANLVGSKVTETASDFHVSLINTELAQQFIIHMKVAIYAGLITASPYVIYQIFRFVSPALYENERKYAVHLVCGSYVMFMIGVLFSYFIIFPFTFRFLGTYQVADFVENTITLDSYISTLVALTLVLGGIFDMPVMSWLLAKMGLLKHVYMTRYRKHVVVGILILAAIITPTSDAFTLMLVSIPMWMLYELSILIVKVTNKEQTV